MFVIKQSEAAAEDISKATNELLYRSMVQAIVLYNSETWIVRSEDRQKLRAFEMSVLRKTVWIIKTRSQKKCVHNKGTWYRERYC